MADTFEVTEELPATIQGGPLAVSNGAGDPLEIDGKELAVGHTVHVEDRAVLTSSGHSLVTVTRQDPQVPNVADVNPPAPDPLPAETKAKPIRKRSVKKSKES